MDGMNADVREEIHVLETERVIGCAFSVLNGVGLGFHEKVYENALPLELRRANLQVIQQKSIEVFYKGASVGEYYADLLVDNLVLVELSSGKAS